MTKRLLKKYLAAFGCTLKDGEICGKPRRRFPIENYLLPSHPLARRRYARRAAEQARVLPALLKAPIGDTLQAELVRRVSEGEHKPVNLPAWSEKGSKPRLRLYSAARYHRASVSYDGDMRRYNAESDAAYSAMFRRWPQVIGKRIQTGNRVTA